MTPRAGRTTIVGISGTQLLVRVAAPPLDGAANQALVALLAEMLRIPRRAIHIAAGDRSRIKRVVFAGYQASDLATRLSAALPPRG